MRVISTVLVAVALAAAALGQVAGRGATVTGCTSQSGTCRASKKDQQQAAQAFRQGMKLKSSDRAVEALEQFEKAAGLVPDNVEYITAREITRQQLVYDHLQKGNEFLLASKRVEAPAEFRAALELDPGNDFAVQRLRDAVGEFAPEQSPVLRLVEQSDEILLQPRAGRQTFHYRGDTRGLIQEIARIFGVSVVFDDSVSARSVRFDVEDVDFYRAMKLAGQVSKTFWSPVSESQLLVAADTAENRRQFERLSLRTFYVSDVGSPQEMNELLSLFRGVFELRLVSAQPAKSMITIRGPKSTLDAATHFLEGYAGGPPQVMLDVEAFEISHSMLRNLGVQLPLQFNMFNITSEALKATQAPGIQDLINQLIASGGINQANTTAIAALLAQLQNQQASIFAQPFATFGKGITLFGVTIPAAAVNVSLNESTVKSLEHVTLRAMQGKPATFRVGTRFPILNATFAPIFNSAQISQVIQNNTFQPAFPSFSYEDLGITVKATPQVHAQSDVTLDLETNIRSLSGAGLNGIPVISNREFKGNITLKNGETAVVVGMLSKSEQKSLRGLPGVGRLPLLGRVTGNENTEQVQNELLVVITPRILTASRQSSAEVWLAPSK